MQRLGNGIAGSIRMVNFPDVCQYVRGLTYNKSQEVDANVSGAHKVLRANNITLGTNSLNFEDVKCVSDDVVVKKQQWLKKGDILMCASSGSQEHVGKVAFIEQDMEFTFGGFMAVIRCESNVLPQYMFYVLTSGLFANHLKETLKSNTIKTINAAAMNSFRFPLPSLEMQEDIVRILDEYSEKNTQLIAALSTELDARKVQYEYYRSMLFSFDRMALSGPVEQMTIGDIGKISMCKRVLKSQTSDEGEIPFYKIGTFGRQANAFITKELFEEYKSKYSYPNKGDILISASGTIGRTVVFDGEPAYFQDSNIVWVANDESKVTNAYLQLYYKASPWKPREGGTITRLYNDIIESTPIAVPSKDDQTNIVEKFGCLEETYTEYFDNLENEIKLRQTQYEYYRDKILTFQEAK
jgi:type I restriction enzyme S subunit